MIQIQRHIEILLLSHDCVIVPGFGGFIAHHVDAHYDEDDRLWLPPYRTLGFNPQLTLNDSLLVQSYVEAYDMSYPDALRRIEGEVEEMKEQLRSEGEYSMDSVGTLRVNVDGHIEFEPGEAGILSPEVYGLADFSFNRLKDAPAAPVVEIKKAEKEEPALALLDFTDDDDDDNRALVVKMSWIRNAVAVAAAIACFFLLATPIANSDLGNTAMSKLQGNIIYKLMPKDSNMAPAQPVEKKVVAQKPAVKPEAKTEAKSEAKTAVSQAEEHHQKNTYCIVLASQVKRNNAEVFINQLKQRGIDARINIDNGTLRVVFGEYDNEAQAYKHLNKFTSNFEFADAWVYKMKGV